MRQQLLIIKCLCVSVSLILLFVVAESVSLAQEPSSGVVKELILPGESFLVEGRPAFILWPEDEKRTQPQPWVFYGPTLPGLPDRHEKWMHQQFLEAGIAVAGIDVGEAYGSPTGQKQFTALYSHLTQERGFASKLCLLGRSRGGLLVGSWAISNPNKVAGLAGIYPVFDLRSYPGLKQAAPAFNLTPEELENQLSQLNPIARIDILAKAKVPLFLIHGDVDQIVPLEQNSLAVAKSYAAADQKELVELVIPTGQGHNFWPGFFRSEELIQFVIRTSQAGTKAKE